MTVGLCTRTGVPLAATQVGKRVHDRQDVHVRGVRLRSRMRQRCVAFGRRGMRNCGCGPVTLVPSFVRGRWSALRRALPAWQGCCCTGWGLDAGSSPRPRGRSCTHALEWKP